MDANALQPAEPAQTSQGDQKAREGRNARRVRLARDVVTAEVPVADGVRLWAECSGEGPALLVLGGIGSGAFTRTPVAGLLSKRMRVVSFDRRASGRSTGGGGRPLDLGEAVSDALAVLDAFDVDGARVLCACAGAPIGLELLRMAPARVERLVVHEPMMSALLDSAESVAHFESYTPLCRAHGGVQAMGDFLDRHGLPFPEQFQRACEEHGMQWFLYDYPPLLAYRPDAASLRDGRDRLAVIAGQVSVDEGRDYAHAAARLARLAGLDMSVISGHHSAYFSAPEEFAREIAAHLDPPR